MKLSARAPWVALVASTVLPGAHAEIQYRLAPDVAQTKMHVAITFKAASTTTALEIPAWGPGSYVYNRAAEGVSNVRSTSGAVTNPSRGKWSVATTAGAETTVSYDLPLNIFAGAAHLSGPALYMYLPDRKR